MVPPSHSRSCLAVVLALVGLAAADIPWPSSGEFPFPGGPALTNGDWFALPTPTQPQFSQFRNGQVSSSRIDEDGSLFTVIGELQSYECLDSSTARYISLNKGYVNEGEVNIALTCAVSRVNATHRVLAQYDEADGKCPDLTSLAETEGDFAVNTGSGQTKLQVFERQASGGEPVLECTNSTKPLPLPPTKPGGAASVATERPVDMGTPLGSNVIVGMWNAKTPTAPFNAETAFEIHTPDGLMVNFYNAEGGIIALNGQYISHQCINSSAFVSSNTQTRYFANGTITKGYYCQKGVRDGDNLSLSFYASSDCTAALTDNIPVDATYTLFESLAGFPAECDAVADGLNGTAPVASSAGRAALGGAVVAAVAALVL